MSFTPKLPPEFHVALNDKQLTTLRTSRLSIILGMLSVLIASYALYVSTDQVNESKKQTKVYEQQLIETRHQIEQTDQQNKKQAADAESQGKKSDDQDRRQSRSYIGSDTITGKFRADSKILVMIYQVKNVGKTKAQEVSFETHYDILAKSKNSVYIIDNDPLPDFKKEIDLYPDQTRSNTDIFNISDNEIQKMRLDDFVLIYYGTVFYRDIFERPHITHFCYEIEGDVILENEKENNEIATNAYTCNNHNSGD